MLSSRLVFTRGQGRREGRGGGGEGRRQGGTETVLRAEENHPHHCGEPTDGPMTQVTQRIIVCSVVYSLSLPLVSIYIFVTMWRH